MAQTFGEFVDPTAGIRAILDGYPFSIGLFREFIQNSDDAGATKQVFLLDRRSHPNNRLFSRSLSDTQGPTLLAYNDGLITEKDWQGLQQMHQSSKKMDTSKIGKYGQGFRSCYHITDNPQVLSGAHFAVFDPQGQSGFKEEFIDAPHLADHLAAFDSFLPEDARTREFEGTVFRLPLRVNANSRISSNVPDADGVRALLDEFISQELDIILLFLNSVVEVEIIEISQSNEGIRTRLARATINREAKSVVEGTIHSSCLCNVSVTIGHHPIVLQSWRIGYSSYPMSIVWEEMGPVFDVKGMLDRLKLDAGVGIAIPLADSALRQSSGRLFSFLPLPLTTRLPFHIHGQFGVTQDRQHLRNNAERVARGSEDAFLVEWNIFLFKIVVPNAIAALLPVLLEEDQFTDVFSVWPAILRSDALWQELPLRLLDAVIESSAKIWPVLSTSTGSPVFQDLGSILIADENESHDTLQILSRVGLNISRVPHHVIEVLRAANRAHTTFLCPQAAHHELKTEHCLTCFQVLTDAETDLIVEYLLSKEDMECIADLPIIRFVNSTYGCLTRKAGGNADLVFTLLEDEDIHVLLEDKDATIWGDFDWNAIQLSSLPPNARRLMPVLGPDKLNVVPLTAKKVMEYLSMFPNPINLELHTKSISQPVVQWLTRFWVWIRDRRFKDTLQLGDFYLVPGEHGLRQVCQGTFRRAGTHPAVSSTLVKLGVSFLHPEFPDYATEVLVNHRCLNSTQDLGALCKVIEPVPLNKNDAAFLLRFFSTLIMRGSPLSEDQQWILRRIPMYPILQPSLSAGVQRMAGTLVNSSEICTVLDSLALETIPLIPGVIFYEQHGQNENLSFLDHLNCHVSRHLADPGAVADCAIEFLLEQSTSLQRSLIAYIEHHLPAIPPRVLTKLRSLPFICVAHGTSEELYPPHNIINPNSSLTALFRGGDSRFALPHRTDPSMLQSLARLGLIQSRLTSDIVNDRIKWITLCRLEDPSLAYEVSVQLLRLIYNDQLDCSSINAHEARWLPTNRGLLLASESRPDSGLNNKIECFDQVLGVLQSDINISWSLRAILGWDKPIPFEVLLKQLSSLIVCGERIDAVQSVLEEIASRSLRAEDYEALRKATSDHAWIPTASGCLSTTSRALLSQPSSFNLPGFSYIHATGRMDRLLRAMGCQDKPLSNEILTELGIQYQLGRPNLVAIASLLENLPADLNDSDRSKILIPDEEGILRPQDSLYFNDMGDTDTSDIPAGHFLVHKLITKSIADCLGLESLRVKALSEIDAGDFFGENFTTRIRNLLKHQYTDQQTLSEFLANAADAGAKKFEIILDERHMKPGGTFLGNMSAFETGPSLVIFNDGVFAESDWKGILRVGIGGKSGLSGTIGQFGLGALSAFHFAEVLIVISGNNILFLDPTKQHLGKRGYRLIPLERLKENFPDHLESVHGLFGFDKYRTTNYNGTIFRLPMRLPSHLGNDPILHDIFSDCDDFIRHVLQPYFADAERSLLFTALSSIVCCRRRSDGEMSQLWTASARDEESRTDNGYLSQTRVLISEASGFRREIKWSIATTETEIPSTFSQLVSGSRIRSPISVGLAAAARTDKGTEHRFFSTLPLPITNRLPVHVTASFILAPDRRSIRLDHPEEAAFNKWLLQDVIPPLYLFLLEHTLQQGLKTSHLWPTLGTGSGETSQDPNYLLITALYSRHFGGSDRRVLRSLFTPELLPPREALVLSGPPAVKDILSKFQPPQVISLPAPIPWNVVKDAGVKALDAAAVRNILLNNQQSLVSLFDRARWSVASYTALIQYLADEEMDADGLLGLQLLPLSNGEWVTFEKCEQGHMYYATWPPLPTAPIPSIFRSRDTIDWSYISADSLPNNLFSSLLNIAKLDSASATRLIANALAEVEQEPLRLREWVAAFWLNYRRLPRDTQISQFPLVHIYGGEGFISISQCENPTTLILSGHALDISACLIQLGATVVDLYSLPEPLRPMLLPKESDSSYKSIVSFLKMVPYIESRFSDIPIEEVKKFSRWVKSQLLTSGFAEHFSTLQSLPMWKVTYPLMRSSAYVPARDIKCMLPHQLSSTFIGHYMNVPYADYSRALERVGFMPSSPSDVVSKFAHFPDKIVDAGELDNYYNLLSHLLTLQVVDSLHLPIPNANGDLLFRESLFCHEPIFDQAFHQDQTRFLHPRFANLERRLGLNSWQDGTRSASIAISLFETCARAIHQYTGDDKAERAAEVYRAYREDLPGRIGSVAEYWGGLDDIRFIPRDTVRRRGTWNFQGVQIKEYPDVVAPNEVLFDVEDMQTGVMNLQAVAWTQRALLRVRPNLAIWAVHPSFGKPTVVEVIEHLRVLVQVANAYPSNVGVLHDLKETYRWLNHHSSRARQQIANVQSERLFLNVDNPLKDEWQWRGADRLFFSDGEEGQEESSKIFPVRQFLLSFSDLLRSAGVVSISGVTCPEPELTPLESKVAAMRARFQEMRSEEKFVDVVFVTSDGKHRLGAHRALLASLSGHFWNQFTGEFKEAAAIHDGNMVEITMECSGECLSCILDYLYSDTLPERKKELEVLLEVLALSHRWEIEDMFKIVQREIVSQIQFWTFEQIREQAQVLEAETIMTACSEWEEKNKEAIAKFSENY